MRVKTSNCIYLCKEAEVQGDGTMLVCITIYDQRIVVKCAEAHTLCNALFEKGYVDVTNYVHYVECMDDETF